MSKLDEFISHVKSVGLARTNRFSVVLAPPKGMGGYFSELNSILMLCDQIQLPGVNLATTQNRSFGEFREVPYEKLYGDIQLNFYVDNNLAVKNFFDQWMAVIQSPTTRTFEYYENYISDMTITVEDLEDNTRYSVVAYECYPKTVSPIQMDYSNKDVMKMQVTMQYKYWKPVNGQVQTPVMQSPLVRNELVPELSQINQVVQDEPFAIGNPMGETSGWGNGW